MTASGRKIEEVVECRGMGEGRALTVLVEAVAGPGEYKSIQVAHNRLQFARTFRPTWAVVAGWSTIWLLGLGAFFFLVKRTETCLAVIETDHSGTRIRLTGVLSAEVRGRIASAFDGGDATSARGSVIGAPNPTATAGPVGAASMMPDERNGPVGGWSNDVIRSVPSVHPAGPLEVPASVAPPTPPGPVGGSGPSPVFDWGEAVGSRSVGEDSRAADAVVPAAGSASLEGATPMDGASADEDDMTFGGTRAFTGSSWTDPAEAMICVVIDDGSVEELDDVNIFGRDPVSDASRPGARLIPISDASRSVSKTHFVLYRERDDWWIEDLHSTNGVRIIGADGSVRGLDPGVPVMLPSGGLTLQFGERTLTIGTAR